MYYGAEKEQRREGPNTLAQLAGRVVPVSREPAPFTLIETTNFKCESWSHVVHSHGPSTESRHLPSSLTRDNPEIYDSAGEKIDPAVLTASRERGEHDIENEMVFRHNPGFVFHDSRGFEAGGESEFNKMKAFITDRSNIKKRLHVIWYCIPTDESARSFTEGEIKFFSQCDTGSIPVMVLFTKFDAFYDIEFAQLRKKGTPWKDAKELALKPAERSFANGPRLGFLGGVQRPPKCHVCLPNMALDDADCGPLMERTAGTLDSGVLTQLFVSTQQTNLELCMKYAVERTLMWPVDSAETTSDEGHEKVIGKLGYWFPHLLDDFLDSECLDPPSRSSHADRSHCPLFVVLIQRKALQGSTYRDGVQDMLCGLWLVTIEKHGSAQFCCCIIFERSFFIFDRRRHLPDQHESVHSFYGALEQYMASPHAAAVKEAVSAAVHAYGEDVSAASRAYEEAVSAAGNSSTWMAKLRFERFQRKAKRRSQEKAKESLCSQAKARLIQAVLQITLKHRLSRT